MTSSLQCEQTVVGYVCRSYLHMCGGRTVMVPKIERRMNIKCMVVGSAAKLDKIVRISSCTCPRREISCPLTVVHLNIYAYRWYSYSPASLFRALSCCRMLALRMLGPMSILIQAALCNIYFSICHRRIPSAFMKLNEAGECITQSAFETYVGTVLCAQHFIF